MGEEADADGGAVGLDGLVDGEGGDVEAVLDIGGGDDELDLRAARDLDAIGDDGPLFHEDGDDGVGRAGIGWSLSAAGDHRKQQRHCEGERGGALCPGGEAPVSMEG